MSSGKLRILLVDDEPGIRRTVGTRLESEGFDVPFAVDGVEALAKVRVEMPDVIILDVMMPKRNGLEICAALRKDERFKRLPSSSTPAACRRRSPFRSPGYGAGAEAPSSTRSERRAFFSACSWLP